MRWDRSSWEVIPMPRPRTVPRLTVSTAEVTYLDRVARSRMAPVCTVPRARILAAYGAGASGPAIAATWACPCRR